MELQNMPRRIAGASVTIALTFAATSATAQRPWPVWFEANLGLGLGATSAQYRDNNVGISADALLGFQVHKLSHGAVVTALAVGVQSGGPVTDVCILKPDGSCVPSWPGFQIFSLLAGWETSTSAVRVMAGPAYVRVDYDPVPVAASARFDAAFALASHFSFTTSVRAVLLRSDNSDAFQLFAIGIGFRVR